MTEFTHLGKYLRSSRLELELTQVELAKKLGNIHTQFISNWERGLCAPPGHCFEKLIEILKLNRNTLVKNMVEDSKLIITARVYNSNSVRRSV